MSTGRSHSPPGFETQCGWTPSGRMTREQSQAFIDGPRDTLGLGPSTPQGVIGGGSGIAHLRPTLGQRPGVKFQKSPLS
jgi:hypothetical protein